MILHVHAVREPGERGSAIVDIFELEAGKIVESANTNTMFWSASARCRDRRASVDIVALSLGQPFGQEELQRLPLRRGELRASSAWTRQAHGRIDTVNATWPLANTLSSTAE